MWYSNDVVKGSKQMNTIYIIVQCLNTCRQNVKESPVFEHYKKVIKHATGKNITSDYVLLSSLLLDVASLTDFEVLTSVWTWPELLLPLTTDIWRKGQCGNAHAQAPLPNGLGSCAPVCSAQRCSVIAWRAASRTSLLGWRVPWLHKQNKKWRSHSRPFVIC